MPDSRNRPSSRTSNDSWLTPPEILAALGPFDLDPACSPALARGELPWRTAARMIAPPDDGLAVRWEGRVWLNPPWSDPLPWAERMAAHGNGVWLASAKSTDTRWAQVVLASAASVLFPAGRPLFRYPDGAPSAGKWTPVMVAAFGEANVPSLCALARTMPGVIMRRAA